MPLLHRCYLQVATNTDASRNAGNAILYECVQVRTAAPVALAACWRCRLSERLAGCSLRSWQRASCPHAATHNTRPSHTSYATMPPPACAQTIMAVESIGGLRVLAVNILGRFLGNKDNNIRCGRGGG